MIRKIRLLIVDDSVVVRKMLTDAIGLDPAIEVVGTAANGSIALQKLAQVKPDIVTLDVEMAGMDGLETLTALRKIDAKLPVIMFSTLTERGAATTLEAISRGATDYVTKPANVGSAALGLQRIRDELVPRIKALCGPRVGLAPSSSFPGLPPVARLSPPPPTPRIVPVEVVVIGVSTGGPTALAEVLPHLPARFPVPILIVQHMPPLFTKLLAERLAAKSSLPVVEAQTGEVIVPGKVWIAPGDHHLEVVRVGLQVRTRLHQGPQENSCRPAVDVLFHSIASVYGASTLSVILTGMGADGLRGCEAIRAAGGQVVVQDEATSVVWGMPGIVAHSGLADRILPLGEIAGEIVRRTNERRAPYMQRAAG